MFINIYCRLSIDIAKIADIGFKNEHLIVKLLYS